jgi:hypothetical protein
VHTERGASTADADSIDDVDLRRHVATASPARPGPAQDLPASGDPGPGDVSIRAVQRHHLGDSVIEAVRDAELVIRLAIVMT